MSPEEQQQLALRAARGDGAAFELLCRCLQPDIWRYCSALSGDPDIAMEAAQETFLRAVTAIQRFRGDAPVRVWLLVIARRSVRDATVRQRRAPRGRLTDRDAAVPAATGAVELAWLIADLDEPMRQAFVLTQVLGLSYEEAATVAGTRLGTIRSRVYRARERLIASLSDTELDEETGDG